MARILSQKEVAELQARGDDKGKIVSGGEIYAIVSGKVIPASGIYHKIDSLEGMIRSLCTLLPDVQDNLLRGFSSLKELSDTHKILKYYSGEHRECIKTVEVALLKFEHLYHWGHEGLHEYGSVINIESLEKLLLASLSDITSRFELLTSQLTTGKSVDEILSLADWEFTQNTNETPDL